MADPQPPRRAARDLLLVFGVAALAIGLGAVAAGLTDSARGAELMAPALASVSRVLTPAPSATHAPFSERAASMRPVANAFPARAPAARGASIQALVLDSWEQRGRLRVVIRPQEAFPGKSPSEATLWDRIRISSPRDPRAYVLGTAIQVHAPAAAATTKCGNDGAGVAIPTLEPGRVAPFPVEQRIAATRCRAPDRFMPMDQP